MQVGERAQNCYIFIMAWDISLFRTINNVAGQWPVLDWLGVFFAEHIQYIVGAMLVVLWFWPKDQRDKNRITISVALVSAVVSRFVITSGIRLFYHHPRPYVVLTDVHRLIDGNPSEAMASFPSGHAAFFFALAMAVWLFGRRLGWVLFTIALSMGVARVFVGVHWPSDIVGGALVGIAVAWSIDRLLRATSILRRQ